MMIKCNDSSFEHICCAAESYLGIKGNVFVEVNIVDTDTIRLMNFRHRGIDKETDVLSFGMLDIGTDHKVFDKDAFLYNYMQDKNAILLGSVLICEPVCKRQAQEYGHSVWQEREYLFLHGLLHLFGYDHLTDPQKKHMRAKEKAILELVASRQHFADSVNGTNGDDVDFASPFDIQADSQDAVGNNYDQGFRAGFFSIVGRPNVGKSSLLNKIVGQKVSIVSYKPQTTRDKIVGIYTDSNSQLVFVDTPGFVQGKDMLHTHMSKEISSATVGIDGVIFVLDAIKGMTDRELSSIQTYHKSVPTVVVINKIDKAKHADVYPIIHRINVVLQGVDIIPLSAMSGHNLDILLSSCKGLASDSARHYDSDAITDRTVRFMVGEIVREKVLLYFEEEVPHGVGTIVQGYSDRGHIVDIEIDIVCNKESHKPILIGSKGSSVKKIGIAARRDMERLIEKQVNLQLYIKVRKDWKNNYNYISDIGY